MGLLKSAGDLVYTLRFLRLLTTPFEKLGAFKAGIIDKDGKKNPEFTTLKTDDREAYRTHYTAFIRLVINLKKIMAKAPGGGSAIARYGAALALIKEDGNLTEKDLMKIHEVTGIESMFMIAETSSWYVLENGAMGPGIYVMLNDSVTTEGDPIIKKHDKIRITGARNLPVHEVLGVNIYEGVHELSKKKVYISTGEISR
jgi:hypothetical protein|tara:strand:- start:585 stop:1184 length:600 start_codon:yes stop_codon:yes gene_type:complete